MAGTRATGFPGSFFPPSGERSAPVGGGAGGQVSAAGTWARPPAEWVRRAAGAVTVSSLTRLSKRQRARRPRACSWEVIRGQCSCQRNLCSSRTGVSRGSRAGQVPLGPTPAAHGAPVRGGGDVRGRGAFPGLSVLHCSVPGQPGLTSAWRKGAHQQKAPPLSPAMGLVGDQTNPQSLESKPSSSERESSLCKKEEGEMQRVRRPTAPTSP